MRKIETLKKLSNFAPMLTQSLAFVMIGSLYTAITLRSKNKILINYQWEEMLDNNLKVLMYPFSGNNWELIGPK